MSGTLSEWKKVRSCKPVNGRSAVQSIDRAVAILRCFDAHHAALGISDIARATVLSTSTAHRLLASMTTNRLLDQGPDKRYRRGRCLAQPGRSGAVPSKPAGGGPTPHGRAARRGGRDRGPARAAADLRARGGRPGRVPPGAPAPLHRHRRPNRPHPRRPRQGHAVHAPVVAAEGRPVPGDRGRHRPDGDRSDGTGCRARDRQAARLGGVRRGAHAWDPGGRRPRVRPHRHGGGCAGPVRADRADGRRARRRARTTSSGRRVGRLEALGATRSLVDQKLALATDPDRPG